MSRAVRARVVPVERIRVHPHNVRRELGDLRPLALSIKRLGVMQPVIVEDLGDGWYRLRDGHRRAAACALAGVLRVPALIHDDILEDDEWLLQSVHVNEQRKQLDVKDRRDVITALRDSGCTWDGIAEAFGVTAATVRIWLSASDRPEPDPIRDAYDKTRRVQKPKRPNNRIAHIHIRSFVQQWRGKPEATGTDILDALEELIA